MLSGSGDRRQHNYTAQVILARKDNIFVDLIPSDLQHSVGVCVPVCLCVFVCPAH